MNQPPIKTLAEATNACYGFNEGESPEVLKDKHDRFKGIREEVLASESVNALAGSVVAGIVPQFIEAFGQITSENLNRLLLDVARMAVAHGVPIGMEMEKAPLVLL